IVASANKADLVSDFQKAVDKAITEGGGIEAFRRDFRGIVKQHGWTGWTGEGSKAGVNWRTRVIYETNMRQSYNAGRWAQLNDPELVKIAPYLTYRHRDGVQNPRRQHQAWNGMTLPREHHFWDTHSPQNGWGCKCYLVASTESEYQAAQKQGRGSDAAPKKGDVSGIDKGFAYNPGASVNEPLRQMVQDKLITYPPAMSKSLTRELNRYIDAETPVPNFVRQAMADKSQTHSLWLGFVEDAPVVSVAAKQDVTGYFITLPSDAPRHIEYSHGRDGGSQRPATPEDYQMITKVLNEADVLRAGEPNKALDTIVVSKQIGEEVFRCVFQVRSGKKNRALSLLSLVIKTKQ
uniref:phage minor head protein n=1 Tax=uncultured Deefgea sp. TaxID=1304914 RepID=UPI002598F080